MWIVAQNSQKKQGQVIYLKKKGVSAVGWTENIHEAYVYPNLNDADEVAGKLKFNRPRVLEYYDEIFKVELEKPLEELLTSGNPLVRKIVAKIIQKMQPTSSS